MSNTPYPEIKDSSVSIAIILFTFIFILCFGGYYANKELKEKCGQYENTAVEKIPAKCLQMYNK